MIHFSLGRDKYDNQPAQCAAANFDDFAEQISRTGSTRKGQIYVCAALSYGLHSDPVKYPGSANWRIHQLAEPRGFLALDGDYFANAAVFTDFQQKVAQWSCVVYTTASHTPTAPRVRAIIELDRSVERAEGIALGEAVERMLGPFCDCQYSRNPRRMTSL